VPYEFTDPGTGGKVPSGGGGSGGTGGTGPVSTTSITSGLDSIVQAGGGVLHGSALMLDRFLALGAPGQGWRFAFGGAAIAAGYGAFRAYQGDGHLPVAIALTGTAAIAAFLTLRPWPQTSSGAIRPGAYVTDVLKGEAPPAGPRSVSPAQVDLTETFLGGLVALWAAGKIGQAASAGASALQNILSFLAGGGGSGGESGGAPPEDPPVEAPPVEVA
jgi:hypothetical protein